MPIFKFKTYSPKIESGAWIAHDANIIGKIEILTKASVWFGATLRGDNEEINEGHHDHLIDVKTGEIIEFVDEEIEKLQKKVAEKYGYTLVDHKLELYGVKKKSQ